MIGWWSCVDIRSKWFSIWTKQTNLNYTHPVRRLNIRKMPVNILARDSIFVLLLWLVGEDVRISDPSGFQFGPNFYLPTILKNVILLNMYFWEIIPSSFVFIKDYEGYDEVSKLAMYWSSQSSEVSTFSVLQNSLWSLFKGAHYLWLLLCLLGELGWVWVSWVSRRDLGELGELGWVTWVTFLFGSWRL